VRIGFFGGLRVDDGTVTGAMQRALLFRLAIDAGTVVTTRTLTEDLWPDDPPAHSRAALQSIVSRLRAQLPPGAIESDAGGYRLTADRADVDVLVFQDLVAAAHDPASASDALDVWQGEPWLPPGFGWYGDELVADRGRALDLGGVVRGAARDNGVPAAITTLIGRDEDLALVASQLSANRLVTIVGPGGAGKTSLALAAARAAEHPLFVELAPVGDGEVLASVLDASGRDIRLAEQKSQGPTLDRVLTALAGRDVLLVLDNCEHVIAEAAGLVDTLLRSLPRLRVLATSREPLGVPGEAFVTIGSLPWPDAAELASGADPLDYAGVELFATRAVAARGVPLDAAELAASASLVARLDGLPLAIELAAARLRTMTLDELDRGLADRFSLLASGPRAGVERHRTLWSLIDWSWELLEQDERAALRLLTTFPSGVAVDDARALAAAVALPAGVFEALVDKSLVQRTAGRFRTLETIREFGLEVMARDGVLDEVRTAQARWLADAAVERERGLRRPGVVAAIAWFDGEGDNIAAALRYAVDARLGDIATRLCSGSAWYWTLRDRHDEARAWIEQVLPLAVELDSDEAKIVQIVGPLSNAFSGETSWMDVGTTGVDDLLATAERFAERAGGHELLQVIPPLLRAFGIGFVEHRWPFAVQVPRGEELGLDPWPTATLHVVRAAMAENFGDIAQEGEASEKAVAMFEQLGDEWGLALSRQIRSEWLSIMGRLDEALELAELASDGMHQITSEEDAMQQHGLILTILLRQGRFDEVQRRVDRIVEAAERDGKARPLIQAMIFRALVAIEREDVAGVGQMLQRIDELLPEWKSTPPQLITVIGLLRAGVDRLEGRWDDARANLKAAALSAIASGDHPVMAATALAFGELALASGDEGEAVRALRLSVAIRGALELTDRRVLAILEVAGDDVRRELAEAGPRPEAVDALRELGA
jgi:predicted ATPase